MIPATKLVNELAEAADEQQLARTIARYGRVDLLCIDELGYMELDRRGAELLFQVLTRTRREGVRSDRVERAFSGWTKTFTDPRLCAAIVDRLTLTALRAIHLSGLMQVSGSPRAVSTGLVQRRRMATAAGRARWHGLGLRVGDQVAVAHRLVGHGQLQDAVEDHAAAA